MFLISFKCGKYKGFQLMPQSRYDNYCNIMDRANKYLDLNMGKFYFYPEDGMKPIIISGSKALNSCFKEEEFSVEECLALMSLVDYNINDAYGFFPLDDINNALWEFTSITGDEL